MHSALLAQNFKFDSSIYSNVGGANKFNTIGDLVTFIIPLFFFIAGVALLLYLIAGGYALMFSGGDPKRVAGAKSTITNALLGIFIVFVAFWLVQLVAIFLGVPSVLNIFSGGAAAPGSGGGAS